MDCLISTLIWSLNPMVSSPVNYQWLFSLLRENSESALSCSNPTIQKVKMVKFMKGKKNYLRVRDFSASQTKPLLFYLNYNLSTELIKSAVRLRPLYRSLVSTQKLNLLIGTIKVHIVNTFINSYILKM